MIRLSSLLDWWGRNYHTSRRNIVEAALQKAGERGRTKQELVEVHRIRAASSQASPSDAPKGGPRGDRRRSVQVMRAEGEVNGGELPSMPWELARTRPLVVLDFLGVVTNSAWALNRLDTRNCLDTQGVVHDRGRRSCS